MKRAGRRGTTSPSLQRFASCAGFATVTLLLLGATVYLAVVGSVTVGLIGESHPVRVTECEKRPGGRGGDQIWCSVRPMEAGGAVGGPGEPTVRFGRQPGRTADVARAPWGEWVAMEHDLASRAGLMLLPAIPLMSSGICAWAAVRAVRPSEF